MSNFAKMYICKLAIINFSLLLVPTITLGQTAVIGRNNSAMINKENIARPDSSVGPECRLIEGKRNGTCVTLWPDSSIKTTGIYLNDTVAGKFRQWYENGQLKEERIFTEDNRNGTSMCYWSNGALRSLSIHENDKIDQLIEWNENGDLHLQEIRSENGGVSIIKYRSNGELEYSGNSINGLRSGQWRIYNEVGKLCSTIEYIEDKMVKEEHFCP